MARWRSHSGNQGRSVAETELRAELVELEPTRWGVGPAMFGDGRAVFDPAGRAADSWEHAYLRWIFAFETDRRRIEYAAEAIAAELTGQPPTVEHYDTAHQLVAGVGWATSTAPPWDGNSGAYDHTTTTQPGGTDHGLR